MKLKVNDELNENKYFTEDDFLRIAGEFNKETQQKYELEYGDTLFYDKVCNNMVLGTEDNKFYDRKRYKCLGTVIAVSKKDNSVKLITPFFIPTTVNMKKKQTEAQILKEMKLSVEDETKGLKKEIGSDIKYYLPNESDFSLIRKDMIAVLNGLDLMSTYTSEYKLDWLILNDIFGYVSDDKKHLSLLLGGIGPDYLADYTMHDYDDFETYPDEVETGWTPYCGMSFEEWQNKQDGKEQIVMISDQTYGVPQKKKQAKKHETYSLPYSFKQLQKDFKKLSILEYWTPVYAILKVDY